MGRKEPEIECLERVLKCSKSQHGKSRKIIDLLNGVDVERIFEERPDFVKKVTDKSGEILIVGIEHFQVDGLSLKNKRGKFAGVNEKTNKDLHSIYDKYRDGIINDNNIEMLDKSMEELTALVSNKLKYSESKTYRQFICNFKEKLENHLKSLDAYTATLESYNTENLNKKMVLLIEIRNEFCKMFINDKNGTRLIKNKEVPLFSDVVDLLDTIDSKKVDYIILCLGGSNENASKIIAIGTENIRQNLKKQNVKVYDYYSYDAFLPEDALSWENLSVVPEITKEAHTYKVNFSYNGNRLSYEIITDLSLYCYYLAYYARYNKKNFVTNSIVQMLLDVYSKYLKGWKFPKNKGDWKIKPVFEIDDMDCFNEEIDAFEATWELKNRRLE